MRGLSGYLSHILQGAWAKAVSMAVTRRTSTTRCFSLGSTRAVHSMALVKKERLIAKNAERQIQLSLFNSRYSTGLIIYLSAEV